MRDCYVLTNKLQALADARILKVLKDMKKVTADATTANCFGDWPKSITPIPWAELRIISSDLHKQWEKWLVLVSTATGETTCIHPDLIEDDESQTTVSPCNSPLSINGKCKAKVRSSNVINLVLKASNSEVNILSDSEEEACNLATDPLVTTTRFGRVFLKDYDLLRQWLDHPILLDLLLHHRLFGQPGPHINDSSLASLGQ